MKHAANSEAAAGFEFHRVGDVNEIFLNRVCCIGSGAVSATSPSLARLRMLTPRLESHEEKEDPGVTLAFLPLCFLTNMCVIVHSGYRFACVSRKFVCDVL